LTGKPARRVATGLLTLLLVTWVVFLLCHLVPGDALSVNLGEESLGRRLPPERVAELRALYHLDEPVVGQYGMWLRDVLRGDLGRSFHDRRPVSEKIVERLGVSFTLNALSLVLMIAVAVPLGAAAALKPGSRFDRWTGAATYALYAVPVFWAGLLLQIVFAVRLDWLPLYGLESPGARGLDTLPRIADRAAHFVLPVACLGYGGLAYLSRFVKANLAESLHGEAVRAARARGLSLRSVLFGHAFRQAAVPMLTLAGFLLPGLVGGSVIVETIFALPGLGRLFVDAVFQRDVPVIMGLTLLSGTATLAGIVVADLLYAVFDPRVRRG
jgi:peptide/nickel transport system permease protein